MNYPATVGLITRINHLVLEAVKREFADMGWDDITPTQALLLFNIGKDEIPATQVRKRAIYLGSNASYNIGKMEDGLYIEKVNSPTDRRVWRVKLTPKGQEVAEVVAELFERHAKSLEAVGGMDAGFVERMGEQLTTLDKFLSHQAAFHL
jgi:DNA-binding MarR family transcriptional regulator